MPSPRVSVVVPVYNTAQFLAKCLDSLIGQTLREIEIVVVNDGSPDNSQDIIDAYASAYPDRIVPLVKENGGLSDARNYGAARARGEFIGFVDSDDYVELDMFEELLRAAESNGTLISMGQYIHYGLNDVTSVQGRMRPSTQVTFDGAEFLLQHTSMVVWNKLYHRSVLERFPFPKTWFEDVAWTPVIMSHTDSFAYVGKPFYHYVRREDSIASSHHDPRTLQGIESLRTSLKNCSASRRDAVVYMAARRLIFETRVRKCYADKYLAAFAEIADSLRVNRYFLEDDVLRARCHTYMNDLKIIPKRIYYSQFGGQGLTETQRECVASWSRDLVYGDGEIVRLDETNCDVKASPVAGLYEAGQYKAVGDYFKLMAVVENGGIGLSQNVMANDFIAPALINEAFFAQTPDDEIFDGAFGGIANQQDIRAVFERFTDAVTSSELPSTMLRTSVERHLHNKHGIVLDSQTRQVSPRITLYGAATFHSKCDASSIAIHVPEVDDYRADDRYRMYSTRYVDELGSQHARMSQEFERLERRVRRAEGRLKRVRSSHRWRLIWRLGGLERLRLISLLVQLRKERSASQSERIVAKRRAEYARAVDRSGVDARLVVLESFYGRGFVSNPWALFEAWAARPDFGEYRFVWVLDDIGGHDDAVERMRLEYRNVSFVERGSDEYYTMLARAGYLINDVTFFFDFIKKVGQVYVNPWHSVSVKSLGYDIPDEPLNQKNVVRNFLATDYFAAANDFVRDRVFYQAHLMEGLYQGEVVNEGHPRNDLTFNTSRESALEEIRRAGIDVDPSKEVLVFAPTWRGRNFQRPSDDLDGYAHAVEEIAQAVGDRYNVLVRLHQAAYAKLPLGNRIRRVAIPPTIDANRMFAATDLLVTDYSSIFFDYLVTGRPIVFYIPDLEEYQRSRGVYFAIDELPGPKTTNVEELVATIQRIDDLESEFQPQRAAVSSWAIARDDGKASQRVLERVLDGTSPKDESTAEPRRPKVLIHAGTLRRTAVARKLEALLTELNPTMCDISVLVTDSKHSRAQQRVRGLLGEGIRVIGRSEHVVLTRTERYLLALAERHSDRWLLRKLARAGRREWRRCLGDVQFDLTVNLDAKPVLMSVALTHSAAGTTVAWLQESGTRENHYPPGLDKAAASQYHHAVASNTHFDQIATTILQ